MQPSTGIGADTRSQDVFIEVGDYRLAATLWTPLGPGPHPAAVQLHGAGPGLRNDYIATVREAFSRGGLAVLACDRPGCGESTGDWQRQTLEQRAEEAIAAVHSIQQHPEVDPARGGLWGQSQGANVASLVAARSSEVAFVGVTRPSSPDLVKPLADALAQAGPPERPIRSRWGHYAVPEWRRVPATEVYEVDYVLLDAADGSGNRPCFFAGAQSDPRPIAGWTNSSAQVPQNEGIDPL
jgi:dipeptidyl aminopeptidase/acylaminoacyl peptidase